MRKLESKPCAKCGQPVFGRPRTDRGGFYYPKLCLTCQALPRRGVNSNHWKGGRYQDQHNGYIYVYVGPPRHYALEHRVLWEQANGPIPPKHQIHHKNEDRTDNRLENLEIMTTSDHSKLHARRPRSPLSLEHAAKLQAGKEAYLEQQYPNRRK